MCLRSLTMTKLRLIPLDDTVVFPNMDVTLPLDVGDVGAHDPLGVAGALDAPGVEPQRLVAEPFHQAERVGDEQNRLAFAA